MWEDVVDWIREPFAVLSGTPVSLLSILTALAIIVASRILTSFAARNLGRLFVSRGADGVGFAVAKITRWAGTIIGIMIALTTVGVNTNAVLAAMTVLLVGIGFGLQKMAENFISGLILLVERPVRVGDFVQVANLLGTVEDIGLRATRVISRDGVTVIVPNAELVSQSVTNYSVPTTTTRITVEIGVAYGTDLEHVRTTLLAVAAAEPDVLADPPPEVRHLGFGDSSVDLAIVAWIERAPEDIIVSSRLRFAIDLAFKANRITIPFPQRDLHLISTPPGTTVRAPDGGGARASD